MVRLLGFLFLGLALLGVFLPLLPTTPFVLVAAACFAQSSEKMHKWILANRTFGPMVRDWEEKRCVSYRVKTIAITSMLLVGGLSIFVMLNDFWWRVAGVMLILAGSVTVSLLETCKKKAG